MTQQNLQTNDDEPISLQTPLAEEAARRRQSPTSVLADIVDEARARIEGFRRQRETVQAFIEMKRASEKAEFDRLDFQRRAQITIFQEHITALQKEGNDYANDMRARLRAVEAECGTQIAALDKLIEAQDAMVQGLTK